MRPGIYWVDLFANTLLVFMCLTVLAFSSFSESPERTLPPVSLAEGDASGTGMTAITPVSISAQRGTGNAPRFFVNNSEVRWEELGPAVAALAPSSVVLRIDEELPTRTAIRLMGLLDKHNIKTLTFAFKAS